MIYKTELDICMFAVDATVEFPRSYNSLKNETH